MRTAGAAPSVWLIWIKCCRYWGHACLNNELATLCICQQSYLYERDLSSATNLFHLEKGCRCFRHACLYKKPAVLCISSRPTSMRGIYRGPPICSICKRVAAVLDMLASTKSPLSYGSASRPAFTGGIYQMLSVCLICTNSCHCWSHGCPTRSLPPCQSDS